LGLLFISNPLTFVYHVNNILMIASSLPPTWEQPTQIPTNQVIALPMKEGYRLVNQENIVYCKAEGNYTLVFFLNGNTMLISRKLKQTAASLENTWFLRIHQSYLVNMRHAKLYLRKSGGQLVMVGGEKLPISKNYKEQVLQLFKIV